MPWDDKQFSGVSRDFKMISELPLIHLMYRVKSAVLDIRGSFSILFYNHCSPWPGQLVGPYPGRLLALASDGLPHGLEPALDQLRGAESQAGPEGGQEAWQAIVNQTQVLHLE